jgi:hypothetical protein
VANPAVTGNTQVRVHRSVAERRHTIEHYPLDPRVVAEVLGVDEGRTRSQHARRRLPLAFVVISSIDSYDPRVVVEQARRRSLSLRTITDRLPSAARHDSFRRPKQDRRGVWLSTDVV